MAELTEISAGFRILTKTQLLISLTFSLQGCRPRFTIFYINCAIKVMSSTATIDLSKRSKKSLQENTIKIIILPSNYVLGSQKITKRVFVLPKLADARIIGFFEILCDSTCKASIYDAEYE